MQRYFLFAIAACFAATVAFSQKKQLDHTAYDSWQRIGEKLISSDGQWVAYTIEPQEGDATLVVKSVQGSFTKEIERGSGLQFSYEGRYLVFKIKPHFTAIREAKIKKKKPEEMPKDSLGILELGKDSIVKIPFVKGFRMPEKQEGWLAYQGESSEKAPENGEQSGELTLRNLINGAESRFPRITEYRFADKGEILVMEQVREAKDSLGQPKILLLNVATGKTDTISRGGNDFRAFCFSEDGTQLAFLAERDARPKELMKYYRLHYYKQGDDSAHVLVDRNSVGMKLGTTVSEYSTLRFSKSGQRLYFGTAPIQPARDTNLVEMDLVKLDIWHYKDDYLQTQQLYNLKNDQEKNYLAVYHFNQKKIVQLESPQLPQIYNTAEGDGEWAYGVTDWGNRIEQQWTGTTKKDIYRVNLFSGDTVLVKKGLDGIFSASYIAPSGACLVWYENKTRQYSSWKEGRTTIITKSIPFPLYDVEEDTPGPASPYGIAGWLPGDSMVLIYDRFDTWKTRIDGKGKAINITVNGRARKENYRYLRLDSEEKYLPTINGSWYWRYQQDDNKTMGIAVSEWKEGSLLWKAKQAGNFSFGFPVKARTTAALIYTKESYVSSPDLYSWVANAVELEKQLSSINPQQQQYWWGTSSIYRWKTNDGKPAMGVLYLPENFDASKKYPVILYFYETHTNTLNSYIPPTPTGSRLNISFFVSRGYIVLSPDIHYTIGHPAKSCFNYVVSAARQLAKEKWVDSKNMGIQGQSWGGIQVAQLVTMTDIFKAAWAGAPVANMTSAYGGIRWESGLNRQFQYEKTQSRIGANLWERTDLYIENSPLFHVPKIKTPLVIMANDADGAVPWYQGIELFTAMRRLGKEVWMLNYNGEAHNLRERKNQKDISIREQQYFDWLLKGEKPPRWITEGVPAVRKGKDWGLELEY